MSKKIAGFIISFVMAFAVLASIPQLAVPVHAAIEGGELYVGGQRLSENLDMVFSDNGGQATLNIDDDGNLVLILTDYTYVGAGKSGAALYYSGNNPLLIALEGENTLQSTGDNNGYNYGIYSSNSSASIIISATSGGKLSVIGGDVSSSNSKGIRSSGPLTIESGEIHIAGGNVSGHNVDSKGIESSASLTISGGEIHIAGGNVTGTMAYSFGINADKGLTISGGKVYIESGTAVAEGTGALAYSYGVYIPSASSEICDIQETVTYVEIKGASGSCDRIKHALDGRGWYDVNGTGEGHFLAASNAEQNNSYKLLRFANHAHSFNYTADGASITAICTGENDCKGGYKTKGIKLTLEGPKDLTYDGKAKEATVTGYPEDTVENLAEKPEVDYYKSTGAGSTTPDGSKLSSAPSDAGDYVAQMTWGGKTASLAFTIAQATPTPETPSDLTATYGQTLADVSLPTATDGTWTWQDASTTSVGDAGSNTFKATFTPTDTKNYAAVKDVDVTITVSKKDVAVSSITAKDKVVDGTTDAELDLTKVTITGVLEADKDKLTVTATGTFEDAEAGENKTVKISGLTLSGDAAANYQLAKDGQQTTTTATILEKKEYSFTSGAGGKWTSGSPDTLEFVVKANRDDEATIDHFTGIQVDGQDVENGYTKKSGSVIIDLQPDYLKTLSAGGHKLKVLFDDADAIETSFTIEADTSPKTGDSSHMILWVALMTAALAGGISILVLARRKLKKK